MPSVSLSSFVMAKRGSVFGFVAGRVTRSVTANSSEEEDLIRISKHGSGF
jgi:hypothetical protein